MAKIPFSLKELKKSYSLLYQNSQKLPTGNAQRLLLLYSVECGLKALWLKQAGRQIFNETDIKNTGHDLNEIIKILKIGAIYLPPNFNLPDLNGIKRRGYTIADLHQVWRYGGQLDAPPINDAVAEEKLDKLWLQLNKELTK